MFADFLYLLRRSGLKVSLTEWMGLMEGLEKGLHEASFTGFYHLCRCLLVKSEADFDAFDRAFLEYFRVVPFQQEVSQEIHLPAWEEALPQEPTAGPSPSAQPTLSPSPWEGEASLQRI